MKTKVQITADHFSQICRICLLPNDLLPINSTNCLYVFKKITNIDIKDDDGLPRNICKICVQLLEKIRYFIEQSKDNYSTLLSINQQEYYEAKNANSDGCRIKDEYITKEDVEDFNSESERDTKKVEYNDNVNQGVNFECAKCGVKFDVEKLLIVHINEQHITKKYNDQNDIDYVDDTNNYDISKEIIELNFSPVTHKNIHNKKVRKKNKNCKYSCTACDRILTSQSALDNHMKIHTGARPYQCAYCDKTFAFSGSLTCHTRTHTGETPYACTICNKRYHSSSSLKKHKETQHFDIEYSNEKNKNHNLEDLEKVQCKVCNRMLNKHGYGTHMRIHTNERKEFVCPFCSKHFKKMSHLDRHIRIHTGERPFVCMICKKPFTQEGDLKRHWAIHSGQKKFQCQHCGKLYFTKGALDIHITVHTGINKSIRNCNICKKPHDQCDEQSHSTLQSDLRSFLCTICGKSFTASSSLKVHVRLHTGDCPFVCTYCGKAYTNTSNLKRHVMRNHTLEKPHVCMICHKAFHDSTNLKRHVNRVHSVLEMKHRNESNSSLKEAVIQ